MKDKARTIIWLIIAPILLTGCIAIYICGLLGVFETDAVNAKNAEIMAGETVTTETAKTETIKDESVAVVTQETTEAVTTETTATEPEQETTKSAEELAWEVINGGINGEAREAYLGARYAEVQTWIDNNYSAPIKTADSGEYGADSGYYEPSGGVLTPSAGVCYFNGHMETYYNLPMAGVCDIMYSLGYSGEYWVRADGCKMIGDYIMVAADFGWLPRGSVVLTSLGWAMVCDTGAGGAAWIDIATIW